MIPTFTRIGGMGVTHRHFRKIFRLTPLLAALTGKRGRGWGGSNKQAQTLDAAATSLELRRPASLPLSASTEGGRYTGRRSRLCSGRALDRLFCDRPVGPESAIRLRRGFLCRNSSGQVLTLRTRFGMTGGCAGLYWRLAGPFLRRGKLKPGHYAGMQCASPSSLGRRLIIQRSSRMRR
jgi:hypothetical protein